MALQCCQGSFAIIGRATRNALCTLFKKFPEAVVDEIATNGGSGWRRGNEPLQQILARTILGMTQVSNIENGIRLKYCQGMICCPITMNEAAFVFSCSYGRRKMIHAQSEFALMEIRSKISQALYQAAIIMSERESGKFGPQVNGDERHHFALRPDFLRVNNISL